MDRKIADLRSKVHGEVGNAAKFALLPRLDAARSRVRAATMVQPYQLVPVIGANIEAR
jgi:hypothetical protein